MLPSASAAGACPDCQMPPLVPVGVEFQNARCASVCASKREQRAAIAVAAEGRVRRTPLANSSAARCLCVHGLNALCGLAGLRRVGRRHADRGRRDPMRALLHVERVQLVPEPLRPVVVPGRPHNSVDLSSLTTGVPRMPHSGSLVLHMSMSLPPGRGWPSQVAQSGCAAVRAASFSSAS